MFEDDGRLLTTICLQKHKTRRTTRVKINGRWTIQHLYFRSQWMVCYRRVMVGITSQFVPNPPETGQRLTKREQFLGLHTPDGLLATQKSFKRCCSNLQRTQIAASTEKQTTIRFIFCELFLALTQKVVCGLTRFHMGSVDLLKVCIPSIAVADPTSLKGDDIGDDWTLYR